MPNRSKNSTAPRDRAPSPAAEGRGKSGPGDRTPGRARDRAEPREEPGGRRNRGARRPPLVAALPLRRPPQPHPHREPQTGPDGLRARSHQGHPGPPRRSPAHAPDRGAPGGRHGQHPRDLVQPALAGPVPPRRYGGLHLRPGLPLLHAERDAPPIRFAPGGEGLGRGGPRRARRPHRAGLSQAR